MYFKVENVNIGSMISRKVDLKTFLFFVNLFKKLLTSAPNYGKMYIEKKEKERLSGNDKGNDSQRTDGKG